MHPGMPQGNSRPVCVLQRTGVGLQAKMGIYNMGGQLPLR